MQKRFLFLIIVGFTGLGIGALFPPLKPNAGNSASHAADPERHALRKEQMGIEGTRKSGRTHPGKRILELPPLEVDRLRKEHAPEKGKPLRFAERWPVDVTPSSHGRWKAEGSRANWSIRVKAPGAQNLNLAFSQFRLPESARLELRVNGELMVRPFTAEDNENHGELWTPLVAGDELELVLNVAEEEREQVDLRLNGVNRGFRAFSLAAGMEKLEGSSPAGDCHIDVVCSAEESGAGGLIDQFRDQIKSAGVYILSGTYFCSGAAINNTRNDKRPLFLTADHCGITLSNAASMLVYWNHENSNCRTRGTSSNASAGNGPVNNFNSGARLRATFEASDMTLVELDDPISEDHGVFLAGWSRAGVPELAVGVHFPKGSEKRISFDFDELRSTTYLSSDEDAGATHWRVVGWELGSTEGGSSGSPLFDQNGRIVGQLHGGYAACGNDRSDWYGKLSRSWDGGGSSGSRLRDWLDPDGSGVTELNGIFLRDPDGNDPVDPPSPPVIGSAPQDAISLGSVAAGQYSFDTRNSVVADTELGLYDSSGTRLGSNDDSALGRGSLLTQDLTPGTYFLAAGSYDTVFSQSDFGVVAPPGIRDSITLNVGAGAFNPDADILATATGAVSSGAIWFFIEVTEAVPELAGETPERAIPLGTVSGGLLSIDTSGSSIGDTELGAFNSSGELLGSNDDSVLDLQSVLSGELSAGTYFIAAGAWNASFGNNFEVAAPANQPSVTVNVRRGNFDPATEVVATASGEVATGAVWFSLEVTQPVPEPVGDTPATALTLGPIRAGVVSIDTGGSAVEDTEIGLYNASGELLATNDDSVLGRGSLLTGELAPGRYFLAAGSYNTVFNQQDFSVVAPSGIGDAFTLNLREGSFDPEGEPAATAEGQNRNGALWFVITVEENGPGDLDSDLDNDGLSLGAEITAGTDPSNPDSDGDGWNDGDEINLQSSPLDAADRPSSVPVFTATPGIISVSFASRSSRTYRIEQSIDLENWVVLEGKIAGRGAVVSRNIPVEGDRRFFRISEE
ncbi:MAG: hypothetical protein CMN02_14375 [Roseibacillus sp.]|nr:hypothetical protein [Roseibacillus sp.]